MFSFHMNGHFNEKETNLNKMNARCEFKVRNVETTEYYYYSKALRGGAESRPRSKFFPSLSRLCVNCEQCEAVGAL